jgi:hypothetical protein
LNTTLPWVLSCLRPLPITSSPTGISSSISTPCTRIISYYGDGTLNFVRTGWNIPRRSATSILLSINFLTNNNSYRNKAIKLDHPDRAQLSIAITTILTKKLSYPGRCCNTCRQPERIIHVPLIRFSSTKTRTRQNKTSEVHKLSCQWKMELIGTCAWSTACTCFLATENHHTTD